MCWSKISGERDPKPELGEDVIFLGEIQNHWKDTIV